MKKVKILTIVLAIILIAIIAVLGIYIPKQNRMENVVKDYSYGMDLKGGRVIILKPDTTDGTDGLTEENYKKSKNILEERLKSLKIQNYEIRLDEQNGNMTITIPEDDTTDNIVSSLGTTGKFEIVDSDTKEVLMNNGDIKQSKVMYGSNSNSSSATSSGTVVYLDIEFNKDGTKKLEDISSKYTNTTSNNTSNNTTTETENTTNTENNTDTTSNKSSSTTKKITMKIDDETIMSTAFDETLKTGKLQLSVGSSSTDQKTLQGYASQAQSMATVLDSGNLPIKYKVDKNQYILSDITKDNINIAFYVISAIVAIALIVLVIRYKLQGLLGAISYIGLVSLLSIILRYTNVVITIEGMFGIVVSLFLAYLFINKLLAKLKGKTLEKETINTALKETYKEFFIRIIPVAIATVVFCFSSWEPLSSLGMVVFWGITLIAVWNVIVSNMLLKIQAKK